MPITFDNTYTYQAPEVNELVMRPAVDKPQIRDIFGVKQGVKGRQGVHYLNRKEKVTHLDAGCGTGATQLALTTTLKQWDPVDLKIWLYECWKDMRGKVLEYKLKSGNEKPDLTDEDLQDYLIDIAGDAAFSDMHRQAWFADTDITTGDLNVAGDLDDYVVFDGIWKKIFEAVTAGTVARVTVANNTAGSALGSGQAVAILQEMFGRIPRRLSGKANQLLVSYSIFDNYLTYRENKDGIEAAFEMQESGVTTLRYRGIPLTVVNEWDDRINADLLGALPHRAILTIKDNLQLGYDAQPINAAGENPFRIWYSDDTERWNAKLLYTADAQVANDELIISAY
jgi:hypothetical protein